MNINEFRHQLFYSPEFQEKWQAYLATFGKDLEELFGGDIDERIRFAPGLECLYNRQFSDAYHKILYFEKNCRDEKDLHILRRLLTLCKNEEEMAGVTAGDWIKRSSHGYYRVIEKTPDFALIKKGFDEDLTYMKESQKMSQFALFRTDLQTYQRTDERELAHIHAFFEQHPAEVDVFERYTEKMRSFRERLLKAGFREAETVQFHFYRPTTDRAALVLNLTDLGDKLQIVYGITTIPDEDWFRKNGEGDDDIKLRARAEIFSDEDEALAEKAIREQFELYRYCSKEEILALKKEKQKEFLQKITNRLKPLGFRKKAAKWTKILEGGYCLEFDAQKSQWSDQYYFNISVYHPAVKHPQCYGKRLRTNEADIFNWQLLSDEALNALLDSALETFLLPILNTPLPRLGDRPEIWERCHCKRNKCEVCWVKKNYWEMQK